VPIDAVAELWLTYYWPIFESRNFLPQMNGEARVSVHRLGFARELKELQGHFARAGKLSGLLGAWRAGRLAEDGGDVLGARLLRRTLAKLRTAIRTGPVQYAGRSTGGQGLFGYDSKDRAILVDEALWREIALMSHWIRDSLLVRWAELTARLADVMPDESRSRAKVMEQALHVLLAPAAAGRDTALAREAFSGLPLAERRCVWTGRSLRRGFEVDHVIPFALWQNNDLWNLLPAARAVNNAKRDRLPDRRLLRVRQSAIQDCWSVLLEAHPRRFPAELARLTGESEASRDLDAGFEALCEAIETTALQRGCERWAPATADG